MLARTVLALVIARSLGGGVGALALYPAALGVLIAGKAYTVARAAAVPRLVPPTVSLVKANARLTVAGVVAPVAAGAVAIAVRKTLGNEVELMLGAAVYVVAAVLALRLPRWADGGGEPQPRERAGFGVPGSAERPRSTGWVRRLPRFDLPPEVWRALTSAASLRWLSGFLLFYGAFVVREHSIGGLSGNVALVVLGAGIAGGNFLGTTAGARVPSLRSPSVGVALIAVTAGVAVLTAAAFGLVTAVALAAVGAATAAMTKLALDSTIQDRVTEDVRSSTFGRSETTMQLAWVAGGVIGILLPTNPTVGFSVASAVEAGALVLAVLARRRLSTSLTYD
jgi:hypothetical protein